MSATVHFFPQINNVPVTHIGDIEPLVYESSETIKFLVARPAQEVCTSSKHYFNPLALRVISIKFLLVTSMPCKTEWL